MAEISHPQYALSKFPTDKTPTDQSKVVFKAMSLSKLLGRNSNQYNSVYTTLAQVDTYFVVSIKKCFNLLRYFYPFISYISSLIKLSTVLLIKINKQKKWRLSVDLDLQGCPLMNSGFLFFNKELNCALCSIFIAQVLFN